MSFSNTRRAGGSRGEESVKRGWRPRRPRRPEGNINQEL